MNSITTVVLIFLVSTKCCLSFSIDSLDKIALEAESVVLSDRQLYLPLGWPAKITCEGVAKLKDINVLDPKVLVWKKRYSESGLEEVIDPNKDEVYDIENSDLNIKRVSRNMDRSVFECIIHRDGNTSLVSRNRVEIQDCNSQSPEDTNAYNLHNPCAFGSCSVRMNETMKSEEVECMCFRHYTGKRCHIQKLSSFLLDLIPYFTAVLLITLSIIIFNAIPESKKTRKQEKMMSIYQLSGFSDRGEMKLSSLYPFLAKLRRCEFPEPDEDQSRDMKYKKLQKKYQKLKQNLNPGQTTTGTTTKTETGTGVSTRSVGRTVKGTVTETGMAGKSTRTRTEGVTTTGTVTETGTTTGGDTYIKSKKNVKINAAPRSPPQQKSKVSLIKSKPKSRRKSVGSKESDERRKKKEKKEKKRRSEKDRKEASQNQKTETTQTGTGTGDGETTGTTGDI